MTKLIIALVAIYTGRVVETAGFLPQHHHIDRR